MSVDLREGLGYVSRQPVIRAIMANLLVVSMFGYAFTTLIPAWAVNILHGNATTSGFLISARAIGSLGAALFIASLGRFHFRGKLLALGSFAFPVLMIVFAFLRVHGLAFLFLFGAGFSIILVFNLSNSIVQTLAPDHLRGRIMAIYSLTFFGSMPLGALLIGSLAERLGEPPAVVINSLTALLFCGLMFLAGPRLHAVE